jgi:hypothetical protein
MLKVSAQPIQTPHNKRIAGAKRFKAGSQAGTIIHLSRCLILIDMPLINASGEKGIALQIEGLRAVAL